MLSLFFATLLGAHADSIGGTLVEDLNRDGFVALANHYDTSSECKSFVRRNELTAEACETLFRDALVLQFESQELPQASYALQSEHTSDAGVPQALVAMYSAGELGFVVVEFTERSQIGNLRFLGTCQPQLNSKGRYRRARCKR